MRVTQRQYERIIGSASPSSTSARIDTEKVRQVLDEAARVARSGRLQEAETMVSSLPPDGPLGPATLDLKAKICAQQGRLVEAQLCWMEAVRQSPGNASYRRSLDYLARILCPSRSRIADWAFVVVLIAVLSVLVILCFVGRP